MTTTPDWETQPHLLAEHCDGCGNWRERIAAYDHPSGVRSWYCRHCWTKAQRRTRS